MGPTSSPVPTARDALRAQLLLSPGGSFGGEEGIRTLGTFRYTRFPVVHLRPLGHLSRASAPEGRDDRPGGATASVAPSPAGRISAGAWAAERGGFEPPVPLRVRLISNQVPSTARSSLRRALWRTTAPCVNRNRREAREIGARTTVELNLRRARSSHGGTFSEGKRVSAGLRPGPPFRPAPRLLLHEAQRRPIRPGARRFAAPPTKHREPRQGRKAATAAERGCGGAFSLLSLPRRDHLGRCRPSGEESLTKSCPVDSSGAAFALNGSRPSGTLSRGRLRAPLIWTVRLRTERHVRRRSGQ